MLVTTSDSIAGKEVSETLGLVTANSVRARNVGRDIISGFKNLTGGEIGAYRDLLTESREEAVARLEATAQEMGADAVIEARFMTAEVMGGVSEVLAYGTAVKLR